MDHVHVYWGWWYHKVYEGELDTVLARLGWQWNTPCERPWWLWNLDLFGFATKYNWTYVVFGIGAWYPIQRDVSPDENHGHTGAKGCDIPSVL